MVLLFSIFFFLIYELTEMRGPHIDISYETVHQLPDNKLTFRENQ